MCIPVTVRRGAAAYCAALAVVLSDAGWARAQLLFRPAYVAVDTSGNIYVTENERHRVRKFDPAGALVTEWGSLGTGNLQFKSPRGIAVDAQGRVYVADYGNARVRRFIVSGSTVTFDPTWAIPAGTVVLRKPTALALDGAGNLYVTDSDPVPAYDPNHRRVRIFNPQGTPIGALGLATTGIADNQFSTFGGPWGVAADLFGFAFVADTHNNRVVKYNRNTGAVVGWAGKCSGGPHCDATRQRSIGFTCTATTCNGLSPGSGEGQFTLPTGVAVDASGVLYVVDSANGRVQKFDALGFFNRQWGARGGMAGQFSTPTGAAAAGGAVYVADTGNHRIQKFDDTGVAQLVLPGGFLLSANPADGASNPIIVRPEVGQSWTISVTSLDQFAGTVSLAVSCCVDFSTGAQTTPAGINVLMPATQLNVSANSSQTAVLAIVADPIPAYGRYGLVVTANHPTTGDKRVRIDFEVMPPAGATISMSAAPGLTPGIPNVVPPVAPGTGTSTVTVTGMGGYRGAVNLTVSCCRDFLTRQSVTLPGVTVQVSPSVLTLPPGGSQTASVTVSAPAATSFGKFVAAVRGANAGGGVDGEALVGFRVLPTLSPPPACRPSVFAIPPAQLLDELITVTERSRINTAPSFAYYMPGETDPKKAWRFTVDTAPSPPVPAHMAVVVLDNASGSDKQISTVGCSSPGISVTAARGERREMTLNSSTDTTLILRWRAQRCFLFWCSRSGPLEDVVVFSPSAFWSLLGGRKFTIRWHGE